MTYDYDVTVIGGGPGGYVAGILAARQGKKTCLIEKERQRICLRSAMRKPSALSVCRRTLSLSICSACRRESKA